MNAAARGGPVIAIVAEIVDAFEGEDAAGHATVLPAPSGEDEGRRASRNVNLPRQDGLDRTVAG